MREESRTAADSTPWKIVIADDDREVLLVTQMVLEGVRFMGRRLEFIEAVSAAEVREIMGREGDQIACILLDVIMEEPEAGLELVRHIREELGDRLVRIILRTGMSGNAPPEQVMLDYDINDYRDKAELSAQQLKTSVFSALRSYNDLLQIEEQRRQIRKGWESLRRMIDGIPSMLAVLDAEARILLLNRGAEELLAVERGNWEGESFFSLAPDFRQLEEPLRALTSDGESSPQVVLTLGSPQERKLEVNLYSLNLGGAPAVMVRAEDVTDRERQEQKLRRAQMLEAVGSLSSGLAHDLNNILGGVIGALALIDCEREDHPEKHNSAYDSYLDTIKESSDKASGLIKQLLTLTRQNTSQDEILNLRQLILRVAKICRSSFDANVEVLVLAVPEEAAVKGNAVEFERMLMNLCINGYQAMTSMRSAGEFAGGELKLGVHAGLSSQGEGRWRVTVEDSGVGMSPELQERIFDPFFSTRDESTGVGFGLPLVHSTVSRMNGEMEIESDPGRGTRVILSFPAIVPEQKENDGGCGDEAASAGKILVCDDEELMRRVAGKILERCGYTVVYAASGDEALESYRAGGIGLVLLDLALGSESGLDIFRQLREIDPGARVLFSSGYRDDERLQTALDEGAAGFLQKPYTMDKMLHKIEGVLGHA